MNDSIEAALERLNRLLPLAARQRSLPDELIGLHRAILHSLYSRGLAPSTEEIAALLTSTGMEAALDELRRSDLIVFSQDGRLVGAYPMTTEPTPHRLVFPDRSVNAMCAIDALSVTPMFGGSVEIRSKCRITHEPIVIRQEDMRIVEASPSSVMAGVRWQIPGGSHAAHSLCMEMVFLKNDEAAQAWHGGALDHHTVFGLNDAVEFGARFFKPLVRCGADFFSPRGSSEGLAKSRITQPRSL